jgi:hypothetical protein
MKKLLCIAILLGVVGYAVYAWAWTAGRDAQPVSGTVTATNTVMVSDSVTCDSITVNPYTDTTKDLTGVKQLRLKARSGIDVRVAIAASGTTTGNNYEMIYAGSEFILKDLNAVDITIAAMGNDATAGDTGILSVVYCK